MAKNSRVFQIEKMACLWGGAVLAAVLLLNFPCFSQPLAGFNASFSGTAEAEGIGFEAGYLFDTTWLASVTFGAIYTPFQAPAATALSGETVGLSVKGDYNDGPEIFAAGSFDRSIGEGFFVGVVVGISGQSRQRIYAGARDTVTGSEPLFYDDAEREYHVILGGELRLFLSPDFAISAGGATRRGYVFGGTIVF